MTFIGKLAEEWEKVTLRFMYKLVGWWNISAYSPSGNLSLKGKILFKRKGTMLITGKDAKMKVIIPEGDIDHFVFWNGDRSFRVEASECLIQLDPPLKKGKTFPINLSFTVGGI